MLDDLRFRLRTLLRRNAAEEDLEDELRFHLERAAEQHVARGLSPTEARRRARLAFGPLDVVKDDCRGSWGVRQLDSLRQDARLALRLVRRHPALSAAAVVSLAIGVGLNTAFFALLDATFLRRLAIDRPEQIVDVYTSNAGGQGWYGSSYPDYRDLSRNASALAGLAGYVPAMAAVRTDEESRSMPGEAVTGNYFQVLGVPARHGRVLRPEDERPDAAPVVVISSALWSTAFDRRPDAVGLSLGIGGREYTIVGVAPERFAGMTAPILTPAFWTPMARVDDVQPVMMQSGSPSPGSTRLESRGLRWMLLKGRLRDGETVAGAAHQLNRVMRALDAIYPASNRGLRVTVFRAGDVATHPLFEDRLRAGAVGLFALLGLVMLIACTNVAGLLLARASARRQEIGLRLAVGASRGRVLREVLVEGTALAVLGVAGGVAFAWGLLQALGTVRIPLLVPLALDVSLNGRVLGVSVVAALGAGLLACLLPACPGTRSSLRRALDGRGPRRWVGGYRWNLQQALVSLQIAASLVLLVMAGLVARNLQAAGRIHPGFPVSAVASVTVGLGLLGYDADEAEQFLARARRRVRGLAGVQAVAAASRSPLSLNYRQTRVRTTPGEGSGAAALPVETVTVGDRYFDVLGVPILRGRSFDEAVDTPASPPVAIVNEAFARRMWPGTSAVGRSIRPWDADGPTVTIVGVVSDYKVRFVREPPTPYIHYAASQRPEDLVLAPMLLARTAGDTGALGSAMRRVLRRIDPGVVFWEGQALQDNLASQLLPARLLATTLGTAGLVAIELATIGLYGVVAFAIVRRTHEIGVRAAMGAGRGDIVRLVLRQGAIPLGIGTVLGGVSAYALAHATVGVLHGVDAADVTAWGGALLTLVAVGAAAHAGPVLWAVRVRPAAALRTE
ncbi:MAG: ADOP family duplicated permease [Acidobacteria bacterium]|nr:ADOP family duplicated permease [Acidobacteriota bacterium]